MDEIASLRTFYKLKSVYRVTHVGDRYESTAEHVWSTLVLADYFLTRFNFNLDRNKVYELIMYHDVVEIHAGDTPFHPDHLSPGKAERELSAAKLLRSELPKELSEKYWALYSEYEAASTPEAKFAHAIDTLDPMINQIGKDYKNRTEAFIRNNKQKYFESFPELMEFFTRLLNYSERN